MKKFISMVMAAAMVVSLVPATAFAADNTCTMKVVNAAEATKSGATGWDTTALNLSTDKTEIQITIGDIDTTAGELDKFEVDLDLEGAKALALPEGDVTFMGDPAKGTIWADAKLTDSSANTVATGLVEVLIKDVAADDETISLVIAEASTTVDFAKGDIITLPLYGTPGEFPNIVMKSISEGATATVAVSGDLGDADAKTFATVVGQALKIKTKKVKEIGVETEATLNKVTIDTVKGTIKATALDPVTMTLRLPSGFVFTGNFDGFTVDGNKATRVFTSDVATPLEVTPGIEAVSAKAGDVATLKVSVKGWDAASCDVAEVIADEVKVTVDEDLDVPVMYSGIMPGTDLLFGMDANDHKALVVTIEESVIDAWNTTPGFTMSLPEGVYVDDLTVTASNAANVEYDADAFTKAYDKGDYEEFVFGRRAFEVNDTVKGKLDLQFTLVAEPGFAGDVVLTIEGDGIGSHEVVIAKFVAPYTVEAAANDVIIDYRNTAVETDVVVKEAEAGLFTSDATFSFDVDGTIQFEDGAYTVSVDEASEAKVAKNKAAAKMGFYLKEASNEEPAVVTINGIELYMTRSLPAGAYDLKLTTAMSDELMNDVTVFGATGADKVKDVYHDGDVVSTTVKEGWINIVTAGRDKDDASFTKKVIVPIGESYLIAGEETVALDVPAYINANDYTMLPVRAVATALGIHNNNVIWSDAAKQVTILYGQRIITMTVGQSVIYVNGSAIPAKAAVEIVDGRAFLGFRDLANALGVVEIDFVDGKAIMN